MANEPLPDFVDVEHLMATIDAVYDIASEAVNDHETPEMRLAMIERVIRSRYGKRG